MSDPLQMLEVFERLEVGPVRIEPDRLVAPYRVVVNGREAATEMIYRYEEPVFMPAEAESQNLAAMIAAQAALNYGLFCKQMVFHGQFDALDRRLLRSMAENTAREIYVKKFLQPNPFLQGGAADLPVVKQAAYLRAKLRFVGSSAKGTPGGWKLWNGDKNRTCILSSGGKDSLLSYGLMAEVAADSGGEVHPLFVNESGRHWFTALNAYRHFRANVPHTGRVWVNSDRLFAWMLRQMPFIRPDFADLRADIYPVRLWTVAVFLFGVLPLVRKRGIGRLIVGDEYDTSEKCDYQGIRHYDGLFDQSIFFDQALSRYFLQKGWSISQFSILRPLSEMLIEKILLERYPDLQQLQMSCHATHTEGETIRPCGRCEKCRRIVGMLTALGGDPGRCGYTPTQIERCLKALQGKSLHQEAAGEGQMRHMLALNGYPAGEGASVAHPEVLQVRIDPVRSPLSAIPLNLRQPLLQIMLAHAEGGAVQRRGQRWLPIDLPNSQLLATEYPFETSGSDNGMAVVSEVQWGEMRWPQAKQKLSATDTALLPVGAIEQHGPHLPLDTDAFDAAYLARRVAEACSNPKPLVLPLIPYGVSYHHDSFPGTISIDNQTLAQIVYDVGLGAARNGIRKLVIINGHGGNAPALNYAAQRIHRDADIFVCVDTGETSDVDIDALAETSNDVHAGEIETSTHLAVRPHLVDLSAAVAAVPDFSSRYLDFSSKRGVSWYAATRQISPSGVMGDPTRATIEKGHRIWEIMTAHLVALIEDLKRLAPDDPTNMEGRPA